MAAPAEANTSAPLPEDLFLDIDRGSAIPLYFQIATRLEQAILDGRLPPGTRLENEIALGERLNLSRPTVRRAMQELVSKGLLVRRRGIGTQVVHGPVTRKVELTSLYEDLDRSGQRPATTLLSHEVGPADEEVAGRLAVAVGSPVLHLRRLRLSDGVPLAVMENYLPEEFTGLSADGLTTRGLYQLLRGRGTHIRVARQRIGARPAAAEEARLLEIKRHGAVLTMDRTAYDDVGKVVEFGHHCYRPDLYAFEITLVDN
ncbi:GntR family transcriptional regulator [Cryptosporangium sp. NPDC051539]|uniref:GntR family transcriptional regulator n=1 Tax=Cryptosporangium sp. NPDC051539 TaxID=3363962 RepID=UPI00379BCE25